MTARKKRDPQVTVNVFSELGPVIPHFSQPSHTSRTRKSEHFTGIAGIGLEIQDARSVSSVPVPRTTKSFPTIVKAGKPGKTVVSKAIQVSSNEQNLFLIKIEALEKEILLLKSSVKEKEDMVKELNKSIETKTLQFTRDIEHEANDHKRTRQMLERSHSLVEEKEHLLEENIQHYEKVNQDLQDKYEEMLASLREQSQMEMNIRDEKIHKLKQQISELFREKSWEHQKQIEELQKELKRLAEEAHVLRGQLKRLNISPPLQKCEKCESLLSAVEDGRLQLKLKNRTIEELQSMCQRFQRQLQEQEKLQSMLVDRNSRNQK